MFKMKIIALLCFAVLGAATLLYLCMWQIQRSAWKTDLIERLEMEYQNDPFGTMLTDEYLQHYATETSIKSGFVEGHFISVAPDLYWPKTQNGVLGFYIFRYFETRQGTPLLINLGWVYEDSITHEPLETLNSTSDTLLKIGGIARKYDAGMWSLPNTPEKNRWYTYDTTQLQTYAGLEKALPPVVLFAKQAIPSEAQELGDLAGAEIYPRNKHHEYAWFWGTMLIIWIFFMYKIMQILMRAQNTHKQD